MEYFGDLAALMDENEMALDVWGSPSSGALQPNPAFQANKSSSGKSSAEFAAAKPGELQSMDFGGGLGGDQGGAENIADSIDDFLDDFLALASSEPGAGTDGMKRGPPSSGALQPNPAFQANKSSSGKPSAEFAAAEPGELQPMDFDGGLGGDQGGAKNIVDSIDDFLDDFLALASSEPGAGTDGMKRGPPSSGALQPNPAFQTNKSSSGKPTAELAAAEPGELQPMDFDGGLGGDQGGTENIADSIDEFLDFLALASSGPVAGTDGMKIPESDLDLAWLDNFDNLPPASPISEVVVTSTDRENISPPSEDLSPAAVLSMTPSEREPTSVAAEAAVAVVPAVSAAAEAAAASFDPAACGALAQPCDSGLAMVAPTVTSAADGEGDGTGRYVNVEPAIPRRDITADEGGGYALMNRGETRQVAAVSAAAEAAAAFFDPAACGALAQPYDGGLAMVAPTVTSAAEGEGDGTGRYVNVEPAIPRRDTTADEGGGYALMNRGETRQVKIARYLAKRNRRCWVKTSSYESRKKVANGRLRHKGRFLPLISDFIPIAELQRRQRAMMKEMQEKAARADQDEGAPSSHIS